MSERSIQRRRRVLGLGGALVVLGLLGGWLWSKRPRELPPLETELPEFVEPSETLPRAPTSEGLGVMIGVIDIEQLDRHLSELGVACDDTGVRAIVQNLRDKKKAELAAADDPDAVSGASIVWRRSKKEKNPQVRLSCEVASIQAIDPTRGPSPEGRALFVFDSPDHPLRHASLRRNHPGTGPTTRAAALRDLQAAIAVYRARFGEPSSTRGALPEFDEELLDRLTPIAVQWRYADLLVEVTLTDFGKMVSVDERIEVPWPVESDAPARPRT
ncbi:hypothetical protein ACNOYE_09375 [Nannocystaceae bacterium ST9]